VRGAARQDPNLNRRAWPDDPLSGRVCHAGVSPSRRGAATSGRGPRRRSASPWRAVPLLVGVVGSATLLNWDRQGLTGDDLIRFFFINAAFLVIGAVGLVLTLPLVSTWAAVLLLRLPNQPTLRLAARRLEVDPTSASRLVAGFGVALFLVTASLGVVAALVVCLRNSKVCFGYADSDRAGVAGDRGTAG